MKNLPSIEYIRECFVYDASTGKLVWLIRPISHFPTVTSHSRWNARYAGAEAGRITSFGYRTVKLTFDGKKRDLFAHRVIWVMTTGQWPIKDVDHINMIRGDNRIANLREATRAENKFNSGAHRDNKLGIKGVRALRNGFQANIRTDGKLNYLGTFRTAEAAAAAYQVAAREQHGKFARS